jgi:hypothetical protein
MRQRAARTALQRKKVTQTATVREKMEEDADAAAEEFVADDKEIETERESCSRTPATPIFLGKTSGMKGNVF